VVAVGEVAWHWDWLLRWRGGRCVADLLLGRRAVEGTDVPRDREEERPGERERRRGVVGADLPCR